MIERIIYFSIRNKFIVSLLVVALVGWGTYSLTQLPIDAIPDITNNQVQVISISPSLAVQEVESSITAPIEVAVANIPNIIELRSISRLGLSVVTVVFKDGTDIYWARQQLTERINEAEEEIPVWQMLSASTTHLKKKVKTWQNQVGIGEVVPGISMIGGGSLPGESLPTFLFSLPVDKPNNLLEQLRQLPVPIVARIENGRVVFDPRTILASQESVFVAEIKSVIK